MTADERPVSESELHAYIDGELDAQRRVEVEAWLACHPSAAQRVSDYRGIQDRLHARFDPLLGESVVTPAAPGRDFGLFSRIAALAVLVLFSVSLGWTFKGWAQHRSAPAMLADLVQPATFAHQVYATDTRYPVEIPALEQASLNQWVSGRMHTRLRAPDLTGQGLNLIGGRLLPSTNRMAAQFMYEDSGGQRLTVYVRRVAGESEYPGVRYVEEGELHVFYWRNRAMGYAVVGVFPAARLIAVADAVQHSVRETGGHR